MFLTNLFDSIKNKTTYSDKYKTHSEAVIISCYFNPKNSPYRLEAFKKFYETIRHLNHAIIECVIGDSEPQLEENANITRIKTDSVLWHKESLLNKIISELPAKYKYIFWVDADVLFTNPNWLVDGVNEMKKGANIIQPFEYGIHLERGQVEPSFDYEELEGNELPNSTNKKVWRTFCANYKTNQAWTSNDYNTHGHVGFAWAAKREILDAVPLFDRAFVGGADHIIAHASAGQINCQCINKAFSDNTHEITRWSYKFYRQVDGKISYVKGFLFHLWHGDITKRQYLKRIQEFTPISHSIRTKDANGLYVAHQGEDGYVDEYFDRREPTDDGLLTSMAIGYMTDSTLIGTMAGGNLLGAVIGEELRDLSNQSNDFQSNDNPVCNNVDPNMGNCVDNDPFS